MKFAKTLTDVVGDEVCVTLCDEGDNPHLHVTDTVSGGACQAVDGARPAFGGTCQAVAELTPAQARTLAKALRQAANVAEGKPAKPKNPKNPKTITDADGDTWYLCPNGFYSIRAGRTDAVTTRDDIAACFGPIT